MSTIINSYIMLMVILVISKCIRFNNGVVSYNLFLNFSFTLDAKVSHALK